ncbi:hypothetical protein D039_3855B, partial [Vibrio parahaemolyticus EKP-028]
NQSKQVMTLTGFRASDSQ